VRPARPGSGRPGRAAVHTKGEELYESDGPVQEETRHRGTGRPRRQVRRLGGVRILPRDGPGLRQGPGRPQGRAEGRQGPQLRHRLRAGGGPRRPQGRGLHLGELALLGGRPEVRRQGRPRLLHAREVLRGPAVLPRGDRRPGRLHAPGQPHGQERFLQLRTPVLPLQGPVRPGQDGHRGGEQEPAPLPRRLRGGGPHQRGRLHRRGREPAAHPDPGAAHLGAGQEGGLLHRRGDEERLLHPAGHRRHAQRRGHDDRRVGPQGPGLPHGDARGRLRPHVQRRQAHRQKEADRSGQARLHLRPGHAAAL